MKKLLIAIIVLIIFMVGCGGVEEYSVNEPVESNEVMEVVVEQPVDEIVQEEEEPVVIIEKPEDVYNGTTKVAEAEVIESEDEVDIEIYTEEKVPFNIVSPDKQAPSSIKAFAQLEISPMLSLVDYVILNIKEITVRNSLGKERSLIDRGSGGKIVKLIDGTPLIISQAEVPPGATYTDAIIEFDRYENIVSVDGKEKDLHLEKQKINVRIMQNVAGGDTLAISVPLDIDSGLDFRRDNYIKLGIESVIKADVSII
ncbi:hypothetical protein HN419_00590 [Candidatus Woesearchaeota archaeon]|jgi:hypothetical protein|nr:hypothetical protein [Candidatus Woesearchaeota archaeon]MBT3537506.1 hypothetical protein [Candidatus Woesearchaeota archaeon]MBT4696810.1 hypothetical protein [Candidatus Woesearchaeota archaeon]MBT4717631.1 hypothetical protein [Candidatus Woesearchaeota archaeon]MBT7106184.1 hypothetical protein [Candidatus Woesearchaeota archaeon]